MNKIETKQKLILDNEKWDNYFFITNWKKEGGVIMLISLLIPLITSFLFMLLYGGAFVSSSLYSGIQMVITISSAIVALLYASRTRFFNEYKIIFFWSNTFFFVAGIVVALFQGIIDIVLLSVIVQTIYQIVVIVLAFIMISGFRENFLDGFQKQWKTILISVVIAIPVMYLWAWAMTKAGVGGSVNQGSIEDIIAIAGDNRIAKIFIFILLFLFVIIAAPIFEELICRYFIAIFSGNRWVTLIISTLAFATLHTTSTGDFAGLPMYIFGSFVMSLAFTLFGSISHSISIHITWNIISYILLVINNS